MKGLQLTSRAFNNGGRIPELYSCNGKGINPPLSISQFPRETKSFVLIVEDPDAPNGTFVHWVLFNISADTTEIPERTGDSIGHSGMNSAWKIGYIGPCPPSGVHRYVFNLYALDSMLSANLSPDSREMTELMHGHILDNAQLIGKYGK